MADAYYKTYWQKNKDRILAKRAERYESDPEYRQSVITRAKVRYQKIRAEKPVVEKAVPKSVAEPSRKLRPRAVAGPDGGVVMVQTRTELARRCRVSPETLKIWEQRGIIPPPTMKDEQGRSWFSPAYMNTLAGLVDMHWNSVKRLEDFKRMVADAFEKSGAK